MSGPAETVGEIHARNYTGVRPSNRYSWHLLVENSQMKWGLVILCVILGSFAALRASGRKKEIQRSKDEED